MKIFVSVSPDFNFWRTVCSHGWCTLPPFKADREAAALECPFVLPDGRVHVVGMTQKGAGRLRLDLPSTRALAKHAQREIVAQVKSCLRLDEDYSDFYSAAHARREYRWIPRAGAGRLLRAPTVFEDVVKMICTTNCSWALTQTMVENICRKLGTPAGNGSFTFPRPEVLAGSTESFLRKHVRAGYRVPYLLELSRRVTSGDLDVEGWRRNRLETADLYDQVRSVKGIGPYAAGNILKLLGHYDHLGIDSWCRKQFIEIHRNGRKTSDGVIERFYQSLGKWRGLFFWLDLTRPWYQKEFPF